MKDRVRWEGTLGTGRDGRVHEGQGEMGGYIRDRVRWEGTLGTG